MDDLAQVVDEAGHDVGEALAGKGLKTLQEVLARTREELAEFLTPGQLNRLVAALLAFGHSPKN